MDHLSRRTFLRQAAAAGAFLLVPGLLAACGGAANAPASSAAPASAAPASSAPASSAAPASSSAASSAAPASSAAASSAAASPASVSASSAAAASPSGEPIKVGLLQSLSGSGSVFAAATTNCMNLALNQINGKGGWLGRPLKLFEADDATDPKKGNDAMNRLINDTKVDVVLGMHSSATRAAVEGIPEKAHKFYFYTPIFEGGECAKYMFFTGEVPHQQITPYITYFAKKQSGASWYFFGNDYNWPRGSNAIAKDVIQKGGGKVVGEDYVPLGTSEFSASINKISQAKPDMIFNTLVGGDLVAYLKQAGDFGLTAKSPTLTLLGEENTIAGAGAAAAKGVYFAAGYFKNLDSANNKAFLDAYSKAYGADALNKAIPSTLAESVLEAMLALTEAVGKAKSVEGDPLVGAMPGTKWSGPRGDMAMNDTHYSTQHIYLGQVQPDGQYKILQDFGAIDPGESCKP